MEANGEQYGDSLKNYKERYHMTWQYHSWAYIGEKHGSKGYMDFNIHCSTVYNSQDKEAT